MLCYVTSGRYAPSGAEVPLIKKYEESMLAGPVTRLRAFENNKIGNSEVAVNKQRYPTAHEFISDCGDHVVYTSTVCT